MTAEVAIANRSGVALAADSAVTVRTQSGDKIWRTANKLFHLSKVHPVGLMVFGSADLLGVPWETLVKVYRQGLGGTRFDSVSDYVDDLISYINSRADMFSAELQKRQVVWRTEESFHGLRDAIDSEVAQLFEESDGPVSAASIRRIGDRLLSEFCDSLSATPCFDGLDDEFAQEVIAAYENDIDEIVDRVFGMYPLSRKGRARLRQLVGLFTTRASTESKSGVVVAGFGDAEVFPVIVELAVDGIVLGRLRFRREDPVEIDEDVDAAVLPFAQEDEVHTFMRGISPAMYSIIVGYWSKIIADLPSVLADCLNPHADQEKAVVESLTESLQPLLSDFTDVVSRAAREQSVQPILGSVGVVPKDELAAMAEALVELTSFRRRVDISSSETVGGAIDVAVISKGDGLVWIKRKHYFDRALNPHWESNYMRGADLARA